MAFERIELPEPREMLREEIKSRILSGDLTVGEKLPTERELSEQTGVNASAVHLALRDLDRMGFVRTVPRHGVYVADYLENSNLETLSEILKSNSLKLNRHTTISIIEMRNAVEGGALIRLAGCHTAEDLALLRASVDAMKTARGQSLSRAELGALVRDFHYLICRRSGNEIFAVYMSACLDITKELWEICAAYWGLERDIEQSEHLVDLIEAGEGEEARRYIAELFNTYLLENGIHA